MKQETDYERTFNREYFWGLATLVVRTMKEEKQQHEADQRRLKWEKNKSNSL